MLSTHADFFTRPQARAGHPSGVSGLSPNVRDRGDFVQLTERSSESSFAHLELGDVRIHHLAFGHGVQLKSRVRDGSVLLGVIERREAAVNLLASSWNAADIAVVRPGELDLSTLGPGTFVWIEANADLTALVDSRAKGPERAMLSPASDAFVNELRKACAGDYQPARLRSAFERTIRSSKVQRPDAAVNQRLAFVREVEAFMWQYIEEPTDLQTVARAMACSTRKLIYYFNRVYGLGPISYFKVQRLNAARAELERSRGSRRVIDVAADFGFWHLGHFGTDYKALFGLTPSQTQGTLGRS